ncbi:phage tail protein [Pseudoxanthobacter sp. M-2]|uniref:phage tail protein n=1 Tax=Pseudoxanthobacter sp. M-2 TaxID=3078754 RepID=UPI0038FCABBC
MMKVSIATLAAAALIAAAAPAPPAAAASEPYLGEVMFVAFGFCPRGWVDADGRSLVINQNQALFSLLGTRFGGNGQTHFKLPHLRKQVIAEERREDGTKVTRVLRPCIALQGIFPSMD